MINILNRILDTLGKPIEAIPNTIIEVFKKIGIGDVKMKKVIMVDDKHLQMDGKIFEVEEVTETGVVIMVNGVKVWLKENQYKEFGDMSKIPEAFDAGDTMFVPPGLSWKEKGPESIPGLEVGGITKDPKDLHVRVPSLKELQEIMDKTEWRLEEEARDKIPGLVRMDKEEGHNPTGDDHGIESGYIEPWPNPGHPDDVDNNVDIVYKYEVPGEADNKVGIVYSCELPSEELEETIKEATIKALRERSKEKGLKNKNLNEANNMLMKRIREMDDDMEALIEDNNKLKADKEHYVDQCNKAEEKIMEQAKKIHAMETELKEIHALNKHHVEQIEIGNERREKIKQTVESLHKEIYQANDLRQAEEKRANEAERELERYKRIVDFITKKSAF